MEDEVEKGGGRTSKGFLTYSDTVTSVGGSGKESMSKKMMMVG